MKEINKLAVEFKKSGDEMALSKLIDFTGEKIMRYLVVITGDREISEDIFQNTWIKVIKKIDTFDERRDFLPWLYKIARNTALDHIKRERKKMELKPDMSFKNRGVEREVEEREIVSKMLSRLNRKQKEIIYLRFYEDMNYEEISKALKIPVGTVKSRLKRTLDFMGKFYKNLVLGE